jgi:hypothetical protein
MISVLLQSIKTSSAINIQYQNNNSHKSFQNPLGAERIKSPPQGKARQRGERLKKTAHIHHFSLPKTYFMGILYVPSRV